MQDRPEKIGEIISERRQSCRYVQPNEAFCHKGEGTGDMSVYRQHDFSLSLFL
jgi:hypothetical protein